MPCCFGEGVKWAKSSYFSYPHSNAFKYFFFLQQCAGTSPLETQTSMKALLSMSFRGSQVWGREGLELVHRPLQGPQSGPRSVCLLPNVQGDDTPPGPPWHVVLDPTDLIETISGWMPNFCCWGGGETKASDISCCRDADICRHVDRQGGEGCYWHLAAGEAAKCLGCLPQMVLYKMPTEPSLRNADWITPSFEKEEQS